MDSLLLVNRTTRGLILSRTSVHSAFEHTDAANGSSDPPYPSNALEALFRPPIVRPAAEQFVSLPLSESLTLVYVVYGDIIYSTIYRHSSPSTDELQAVQVLHTFLQKAKTICGNIPEDEEAVLKFSARIQIAMGDCLWGFGDVDSPNLEMFVTE